MAELYSRGQLESHSILSHNFMEPKGALAKLEYLFLHNHAHFLAICTSEYKSINRRLFGEFFKDQNSQYGSIFLDKIKKCEY
jgi:hypothetical protein